MTTRLPTLPALAAALALAALAPAPAARAAEPCGLPAAKPLWIDFGTPGPITRVFGRPGIVLGASTGDFPAKLRATGAQTVYWDMNLNKRVGTPQAPTDPASIPDRADRLAAFAAQQSGCATPRIVLNELFGAGLETPWSATNTTYRANVLALVRRLAEKGAKPYLLVPALPYTEGEAGDWWRELSKSADIVLETYFSAPGVVKQGTVLANRRLRTTMRRAVGRLTEIGIPPSKLGIVLGFQTSRGSGGREGLEPSSAWFRFVKWQTLAAKQVARETRIATVISWGWASYRASAHDEDKIPSACVYLWARDRALCDGPKAAGPEFEASLTEGQIALPRGAQCTFGRRAMHRSALAAVARVTGDREVAYAILLGRMAEQPSMAVPARRVLAAERAVVASRFRGSRAAYLAALARAGATLSVARGVLADELRRYALESSRPARRSASSEVGSFYAAYPDLRVRLVEAKPAPWWLGGRTRGWALEPLAPLRLFLAPTGRRFALPGVAGTTAVRPLGDTQPLASLPLSLARGAITAALGVFARRSAYESWSVGRQASLLRSAICSRDDLPDAGAVRLVDYLPFLAVAEIR